MWDETPPAAQDATIPPPAQTQLYLAFGSNLSPTQMRSRCSSDPAISAKPLAIARLDRWRWIISERGYGNVVPATGFPNGNDDEEECVYGLVYGMTKGDEAILDMYEGVDRMAPSTAASGDGPGVEVRPRDQGVGSYNKWYLRVKVDRWLDERGREKIVGRDGGDEVIALVYVDEYRVSEGVSRKEYVARMNQGIEEAGALWFPMDWVDRVMRRFIPKE